MLIFTSIGMIARQGHEAARQAQHLERRTASRPASPLPASGWFTGGSDRGGCVFNNQWSSTQNLQSQRAVQVRQKWRCRRRSGSRVCTRGGKDRESKIHAVHDGSSRKNIERHEMGWRASAGLQVTKKLAQRAPGPESYCSGALVGAAPSIDEVAHVCRPGLRGRTGYQMTPYSDWAVHPSARSLAQYQTLQAGGRGQLRVNVAPAARFWQAGHRSGCLSHRPNARRSWLGILGAHPRRCCVHATSGVGCLTRRIAPQAAAPW